MLPVGSSPEDIHLFGESCKTNFDFHYHVSFYESFMTFCGPEL